MPQRVVQVDAFADRPFAGNPAAVCVLEAPREDAWMQAVAAEMNLSETAFLLPEADGWRLRWFTPTTEVDLCGHATLASAHVLWEEGRLPPGETARFHTRSGVLTATREGSLIWLDFPATPPETAAVPIELQQGLRERTDIRYVGRTPFDYLVELGSESAVRSLAPDLGALTRLGARGVIV